MADTTLQAGYVGLDQLDGDVLQALCLKCLDVWTPDTAGAVDPGLCAHVGVDVGDGEA